MTVKRNSLGRNLSALLSQSKTAELSAPADGQIIDLSLACLKPGKYQPRTDIHDASLDELTQSIRQQGLLQPLVVRQLAKDEFEIIAGERRWRACQRAGLTRIPVLVREVDDETAMAIALVENLQREALNAMDQARAMHRLTEEFKLTHQQVADLLSKSRTAVSNFLRLLSLHDEVKSLLEQGALDQGHARALLTLDPLQQKMAADRIVAEKLSVRDTEKLVEQLKNPKSPRAPTPLPQHISANLQRLTLHLNTTLRIKHKKSGRGEIVIDYHSPKAFDALIQRILAQETSV